MSGDPNDPALLRRDGTSQAGRRLVALEPDYAPVEERSISDWLTFADAFGKELRFFDRSNQVTGDWGRFVDPTGAGDATTKLAIAELVSALEAAGDEEGGGAALSVRPHMALFLTFLKLLEQAKDHLNGLTRRHLEFYYERVLRMTRKAAVVDSVHVLFGLSRRADPVMLPAGTRLAAGKDDAGRPRSYGTDRELVVNRARVARLSSIYADWTVTGLREARLQHGSDWKAGYMAMLEVALGHPQPGDALPPFEGYGSPPNVKAVGEVATLLDLCREDGGLFLDHGELRDLMILKRRRKNPEADWTVVNGFLEEVGRAKGRPEDFELPPPGGKHWDFDANLAEALGEAPSFGELPGIETVEDLYDQLDDEDVCNFVVEQLFFKNRGVFASMMQKKELLEDEWRDIASFVELAGRRQRRRHGNDLWPFKPEAPFDVVSELEAAVGNIDWPKWSERTRHEDQLDAYAAAVERVEDYFYLPAEDALTVTRPALKREAPNASEWAEVESLLDQAYRNKVHATQPGVGKAVPAAQIVTWQNLVAYDDATTAPTSRAPGGDVPAWKTLGGRPPEEDAAVEPPPRIGWAFSSPVLLLGEGVRTITLTLGFRAQGFSQGAVEEALGEGALAADISTVKGWTPFTGVPDKPSIVEPGTDGNSYQSLVGSDEESDEDLPAMRLTLCLGIDGDPTAPPPGNTSDASVAWPMLRLRLKPLWDDAVGRWGTRYEPFRDLVLVAAHVKVEVTGLASLRLWNDAGEVDPAKPFMPFGPRPTVGSRFILGHEELARKRLDSLSFDLEWMGLPANLTQHYDTGYKLPAGSRAEGPFVTRVSIIDRRHEEPLLLKEEAPLFTRKRTEVQDAHQIPITKDASGGFERWLDAAPLEGDPAGGSRYLQWELLAPDFQHSNYPSVAQKAGIELANALNPGPVVKPEDFVVNAPYTPTIKRISIDYTASLEVVTTDVGFAADGADRLFHIHPFGVGPAQSDTGDAEVPFLPSFDHEGELFVGLSGVEPPQLVTLLFQLSEGSADPDLERAPVVWSYLSGDRWVGLTDGELLSDATRGLINSGIVEVKLPPVEASSRLDPGLYWLRVAVARHVDAVCDTLAVHTQAVRATRLPNDDGQTADEHPLPAYAIKRLVKPVKGVVSVEQPYTSFGGRPPEPTEGFYNRVAERLRHKHRALTPWDYERLVLERFPQVYKVKCLPANITGGSSEPGRVDVIVIPDVRHQRPFEPFGPKLPVDALADIETYLQSLATAHATVRVRNAHYVSVRVQFDVRYRPDVDEGYAKRSLVEALNRFLSPWAYDPSADIVIGGRIYANSIIDFLDRQPCVDYIAALELSTDEDGSFVAVPASNDDGYYATTERPDGVLVGAREHEITEVPEVVVEDEVLTGINYMRIGLDFIVGPQP